MGIPDTYTMPLPHSHIFTVVEDGTSSSISSTQEHRPQSDKNEKDLLNQSVSLNEDCCNSFTCQDIIMEATNIKIFTPAEIKKATCNYSEHNIIGQGGFGTVFKGILSNNQLIAVKRYLQEESYQGKDVFTNEIIILSQINHRNVVKLLGCCFDVESPSIVYEFVPNGSLWDHLFDVQNSCILTWNHRLRIALEIAQVLAYLHTTIRVPIIHRDIKSSNILLNHNYVAKVSDFGISKLLRNQNEFVRGVEDIWEWDRINTRVMGTYGYADPQYVYSGRLTNKSDVYSFGVVLTELLTRKKAFCVDREEEERHLPSRFVKLKGNRLIEILDEQLVNEGSMKQLKKVARLAKRCLQMKAKDRPTMRQVVRELQDIIGF